MEIVVSVQMGKSNYTFKINEAEDKKALHKAITFGNPPSYCHECKNTSEFSFNANQDKDGNLYIKTHCNKCGAEATLGSHKSGGLFFWKKFEKYVPKTEGANE